MPDEGGLIWWEHSIGGSVKQKNIKKHDNEERAFRKRVEKRRAKKKRKR